MVPVPTTAHAYEPPTDTTEPLVMPTTETGMEPLVGCGGYMSPPPHDRSVFRNIQALNFRLAWTKSVQCWPASFNIFDQLLADY